VSAFCGLTGLAHVLVFVLFALNEVYHSLGVAVGHAVGDIGMFANCTSDLICSDQSAM